MDQNRVVFPAERDRVLQVVPGRGSAGGIVGVVEDDDPGAIPDPGGELPERNQEVVLRSERDLVDLATGQGHPTAVGLVSRIRDDRHLTRIEHGEGEVSDPLLGADEGQQLVEGIQVDAEALLHPVGETLPKRRVAQLKRVPGHGGIRRGPGQRLHGGWRGRQVGVPGAQVDDVHTLLLQAPTELGNPRQGVTGKAPKIMRYRELTHASSTGFSTEPTPGICTFTTSPG